MKKTSSGNKCLTINELRIMKKIYSFMVAAVALFAASCNKELPQEQLPAGETVVYTASVDGADTKAVLNEATKKSEWVAGDAITVHDGTKGWTFTADKDGQHADFSNSEGFGDYRPVMAVYPAGEYTAKIAAKTARAYIPTWQQAQIGTYHNTAALAVAYSESNSFAFKNAHALLKFTVKANNVTHLTFHGNKEEAITGNVYVTLGEDGVKSVECLATEFTTGEGENKVVETKKGTWVECYAFHDEENKYFLKGETYYIAVAPQVFETGVTVKVRIDEGEEIVVKTTDKNVETKINTILNLGEIKYDPNEIDATPYGLVGSFQGWDPANSIAMEYDFDGWIVAKNVELYKDDAFKFVLGKTWDVNYGTSGAMTLEDNKETSIVENGQNVSVSKNGKYNLYLNPKAMMVKAECVEEYTDLMVNITIDNKAKWDPLTITLKKDDNVIVDKVTVTGQTYAISGDYIGSTLICQFHSGDKDSKIEELTITKNGAQATVESTEVEKPKLYLTPNSNWKKDNARFAAYFFGNGDKWASMTDPDKDGVYEVEIPDGYPNVIFCRMNPSASANNWNNKWNQTGDLVIPTNGDNHYTVKAGTWDNGGGTWSKK